MKFFVLKEEQAAQNQTKLREQLQQCEEIEDVTKCGKKLKSKQKEYKEFEERMVGELGKVRTDFSSETVKTN